jgi:hypothetical protein
MIILHKLKDAIAKTQKNVNFKVDEDTPYGNLVAPNRKFH